MLGGGSAAVAAYLADRRRFKREDDRYRDHFERRQVYTEFVVSWHTFEEVITRRPSASQPLAHSEELEKAELQFQRSYNALSLIAPVEVTEAAADLRKWSQRDRSVRDEDPGAPGRFWKAARKDLGKWPSR